MNLDDLKPDPKNPRTITEKAASGLRASLRELGDLSGIVWNHRTGFLVAGHQRVAALKAEFGEGLRMEGGALVTPKGDRFPVRVVDWPPQTAALAMIAANNPETQGTYTDSLPDLLLEVKAAAPDLAAELLVLDLLGDQAPDEALAAEIGATSEWSPAASARKEEILEKTRQKLEALAEKEPEKVAHALAVVVGPEGNDCFVLVDPATADIVAELKRYADAGEESPLAALAAARIKL